MGLLIWLIIVFVIWIIYLEFSPRLGNIILRPNSKGTTTFTLAGVGALMAKPLTDKTFWYPSFWDLNIYVLWIITAIIYFLIYRNLNLISQFKPMKAVSVLSGDSSAKGVIEFTQDSENGPLKIQGTIRGLTRGLHGFHVHEYGDTRNGCDSAGAHFNPDAKEHGGLDDSKRHAGDLGNIVANYNGVAEVDITDTELRLNGKNSIIGRTLIVHQDPDDLGKGGYKDSLTTGHSGKRIACGVIGLAKS